MGQWLNERISQAMQTRREHASTSSRRRRLAAAHVAHEFKGIEAIPVIDYLGDTPTTTSAKVKRTDQRLIQSGDMRYRLDLGRPKVPYQELMEVGAHDRPMHVPGKKAPWQPFIEREVDAHDSYSPSSTDVHIVNDDEEGSSWKHRQCIARLTPNRARCLREGVKHTDTLNEESRGQIFPLQIDSQEQVANFLLQHDGRLSDRWIAVTYETRKTPGMQLAQKKMGNMLRNLAAAFPEEVGSVASNFPRRVRRNKPGPSISGEQIVILDENENFDAAKIEPAMHAREAEAEENDVHASQALAQYEEYDIIDFSTKDELEHVFDQPNATVGVYNADEVELYLGLQWKAKVEQFRAEDAEYDVDAFLAQYANLMGVSDEKTLDERIENAKAALVKKGKMLPEEARKLGTGSSRKRKTPVQVMGDQDQSTPPSLSRSSDLSEHCNGNSDERLSSTQGPLMKPKHFVD